MCIDCASNGPDSGQTIEMRWTSRFNPYVQQLTGSKPLLHYLSFFCISYTFMRILPTHITPFSRRMPSIFKCFPVFLFFLVLHICITNHNIATKVRNIDNDLEEAGLLYSTYTGKEIQRPHTFICSKPVSVGWGVLEDLGSVQTYVWMRSTGMSTTPLTTCAWVFFIRPLRIIYEPLVSSWMQAPVTRSSEVEWSRTM